MYTDHIHIPQDFTDTRDRLTERASGSHAKERVRLTSGFSTAKLDAKRQ